MAAPEGNKYAVGNNGGRPPLYESPEQLQQEVDAYFEYIEGEAIEVPVEIKKENGETTTATEMQWVRRPEPATVTGLTLYLGFSDRSSLSDYAEKQEFSHIIKRAKARVEHEYEKNLYGQSPTGSIFALKNMGWRDKQEVDHTTKGDKIGQQDLSKYTDDELRILAELQRKGRTSEA